MGSRAGYVVKRDGVAAAYGAHWGASSIMDDIFWGPERATEAFLAQEPLEELEEIDGGDEGTVLIDWDAKRMMWWAANCELPAHQRLFNRLAAQNWPGWQIETAQAHQGGILGYLGIDLEGDREGEAKIGEDEHREEQDDGEPGDGDEHAIEQEYMMNPELPEPPISDLENLKTGCWLSVRRSDGDLEDYFIAEHRDDDVLRAGRKLLEGLPRERALGAPAPELASVSGVFIDCRDKFIWRWQGPRYGWNERQLQKNWPDFTLRDVEQGWLGQVQATGRLPGDLQANERDILGAVVTSLLVDSSVDPRKLISDFVGVAKGLRVGCLGVTLLVGLLGGGLALWLDKLPLTVIVVLVFLVCLGGTIKFWRKSATALSVVDLMPPGDKFHKGMNVEEKRPIMSRALTSAGFPSLEELEAAGEVKDLRNSTDDGNDDDPHGE